MIASKMNLVLRAVSKNKKIINQNYRAFSSTILNQSTPLAAPDFEGQPKVYSEKITSLVKQISQLNLLEVSDLNDLLRKTLNIRDVPMGGSFAATATAAAPAAAAPVEEEAAPVSTKSSFRLKLVGFNQDKKVQLIKEIKSIGDNMNLVQAKKFVESVPQVLKDNIGKEEADKLKQLLEKAGATVEIE